MEVSKFNNYKDYFNPQTSTLNGCEKTEELYTAGSTCNPYRAKIYGKLIFIKKLKPQYAENIIYREALHKEFETGFRLEHPNLARYIALQNNSIHIEYIDGETLTEKLASNPQYFKKRENCDKFIKQLLSAVQYLHSNQVVHLDIKPDNILITRINNDVKLVDLGLCHTDCYIDTTGYSEKYAAPEQKDNTAIDERSDIYALGRIIELLPNAYYIYNKVIKRCTAKNKEERYNSVKEIAEELQKKKNKQTLIVFVILAGIVFSLFLPYLIKKHKTAEENTTKLYYKSMTTQEDFEQFKERANTEHKTITEFVNNSTNLQIINKQKTTQENTAKPYYERVATQDEFELFKERLNTHYKAVADFVNDNTNLQKYPSYISYCTKYKELMRGAVKSMHKDEWTYNGFKSITNPVASYRRTFLNRLDSLQRSNADKLP